jgi:hypothetical protein
MEADVRKELDRLYGEIAGLRAELLKKQTPEPIPSDMSLEYKQKMDQALVAYQSKANKEKAILTKSIEDLKEMNEHLRKQIPDDFSSVFQKDNWEDGDLPVWSEQHQQYIPSGKGLFAWDNVGKGVLVSGENGIQAKEAMLPELFNMSLPDKYQGPLIYGSKGIFVSRIKEEHIDVAISIADFKGEGAIKTHQIQFGGEFNIDTLVLASRSPIRKLGDDLPIMVEVLGNGMKFTGDTSKTLQLVLTNVNDSTGIEISIDTKGAELVQIQGHIVVALRLITLANI